MAQRKQKIWAMEEKNDCVAQRKQKIWAIEEKNGCVAQKEKKTWVTEEKNGCVAQNSQKKKQLKGDIFTHDRTGNYRIGCSRHDR